MGNLRNALILIGAVFSAMLFPMSREAQMQAGSCVVSTVSGAVQGVDRGASCAFLGIPYAAPPVGSARWQPPQPGVPWAPSTLNASVPPPNCPSLNVATGQPGGNEDCLKLNIWTPDPPPTSPAPVIVWLHTGGFMAASANFAGSNGQRLAEQTGAIVVAPNYRLGPFGFLAHAALSAENPGHPSSGNFGLLDQRAALTWVRHHIGSFGGDAGNVTLAGTSAGGLSVSLHLVSPGSASFFDRAIIQSGAATYRWPDRIEAEAQGSKLAAALGCTDEAQVLPCLRSRTRDQVLLALPVGQDQIVEGQRVQWLPVVDGVVLPDQPRHLYESGAFNRVPVIVGTNRDEGWPFVDRSFPGEVTVDQYETILESEFGSDANAVLAKYRASTFASPKDALARLVSDVEYVCEARRVAQSIARTRTPVYMYSFEYEIDAVAPDRVIHGLESNLLFGNNFGPPSNYVLGAPDLALFDAMSGYWTRFAATGNPNISSVQPTVPAAGAVRWPRFRHSRGHTPRGNEHSFLAHVRAVGRRGADGHLVLDMNIRQDRHLRRAACDFWEPYSFRSVVGAVPASQP